MVRRLIPQAAFLLFLKREQLESAAATEGSEAREGLLPMWQCREEWVEIGTGASEADLKMPRLSTVIGCAR